MTYPATAAAAAVGVILTGGLTGCSAPPPDLAAADLQARIIQTLTGAGVRPESVSCAKDLPAKVGASVRCEVVFAPADRVEAVVTTTSVGGDVGYELSPRLTSDQVARRVAAMTSAQSVDCESGLDPAVGDWTQCVVTRAGGTSDRAVEVTEVTGLRLGLRTSPVLNKGRVEQELSRRLAASTMRTPDSVMCYAGLPAEKGVTTECVVNFGDAQATYTLTVTAISDDTVEFDYVPKGQNKPPAPTSTTPQQSAPPVPPPPPAPEPLPPPPAPEPPPPAPPRGAIGEQ